MRMLVLLLCLLVSPALGEELHIHYCLHGCPAGAPVTNDLIVREIYVLSSNDTTKFADWTAYRVTENTIGPTQNRNFKTDPLLAGHETLEPSDYTGANAALGTERGHQVPLASFTGTAHWKDTNYLSNITPQQGALNGGAWGVLEQRVRDLAEELSVSAVYVMTGTLYEQAMPSLPQANELHMIPSGYWKVVATEDGTTIKVAAFIFGQGTPSGTDICGHLITVRTVEQRSTLDFFHALSSTKQNAIEQSTSALATDLGCSP
jgi:endonuclease G